MLLSIISGTWNRINHMKAMVDSARKSLPPNFIQGRDYEFVITDGGSTDGSLEWMKQEGIQVIDHGCLKGAIKAFNDAGAAAQGDYILVANDDIQFLDYSVARGLAFMMDNPDIGAGCFYQDRAGKDWHVETMPLHHPDGSQEHLPYMQVGLIPRWLWDACGGWGDWGGKTYGGDNYLTGKVYEAGYKVVPIEGCKIHDSIPRDALREKNERENNSTSLWDKFQFQHNTLPQHPNPLQERKRVLYAPIIEAGHDIQKAQKRGLREGLQTLGTVWEVDYIYSKESILEAAKAWRPHYVVTQFHTHNDISIEDAKVLRASCQEWMANFSGDVWSDQATPQMMELLRLFDYQLTVNASLLPSYEAKGIRAAYWQNSFEPPIIETEERGATHDVVFLGNNYQVQGAVQSREALVKALISLPYNVGIYGRGYPEGVASGESLYNFRKTGELYRGAKIAIGDNQFLEATGFASDRMFMILASGNCLMMHQKVNGMESLLGLVPGVHFVEWTDLADLKAKVAYYLEHEEERKRIADAGTRECRANHTYAARVAVLKDMMSRIPTRKDTISACMIVRNESRHIGYNLDQLATFADEIVIVDTGSTDGTPEAIMKHPAYSKVKLEYFEWCDDFSAARNYAKSLCTRDWIYWQDADDRISPKTLEHLQTKWPWKKRSAGIINPMAIRVFYQGGENGNGCMQTRFFRNIPKIEWRGRAMESVDESLHELGIIPLSFTGELILHLEEKDPVVQAQKQSRYISMLKKESASPWRDFQVGNCYAAMERWGDAFLHFWAVYKHAQDPALASFLCFAIGHCAHKLDMSETALPWLEKSQYPDAYYLRFLLEEKEGETRYDLLQKFLDGGTDPEYPTFAHLWRDEAKRRLGIWYLSKIDEFLDYIPAPEASPSLAQLMRLAK
jgi:glycosyltransferase involved in cell wall biosynthesis